MSHMPGGKVGRLTPIFNDVTYSRVYLGNFAHLLHARNNIISCTPGVYEKIQYNC